MSDDFGTVSAKRGDRGREIEALRARYRRHRDALMGLVSDAPTELIAADYRRVIADIDVAMARLNEAELPVAAPPPPPPLPTHPARRGMELEEPPPRLKTEPGMRPLVTTTAAEPDPDETITYGSDMSDSRSRLALIAVAAILALAAIAYLIWKASDRPGSETTTTVAEETVTSGDTTATLAEDGPVTPEDTTGARPAAGARPITVTPDSIDYGIVQKGTRVTRQYEIVNNGDEPISPQVSRSTCRCLYYEHAPVVPPKAKETLTVTIDGAKAKAGPLLESIRVSAKSDPSIVATFDVTATVRQ
ncbi:MAG TPA: DUF1573 domain-containing protein [Thermoanaerobaculia bacterium]|nr:DUF1573 domain-containing protein [Thermoanaerobaculia bacterium]